jgi:hypothetical protein
VKFIRSLLNYRIFSSEILSSSGRLRHRLLSCFRFSAVRINGSDWQGVTFRNTYQLDVVEKKKRTDRSSSHPYALGVSLITVCKGILMYGRSSWGRWWKYAYLRHVRRFNLHPNFIYSQTPQNGLRKSESARPTDEMKSIPDVQ